MVLLPKSVFYTLVFQRVIFKTEIEVFVHYCLLVAPYCSLAMSLFTMNLENTEVKSISFSANPPTH